MNIPKSLCSLIVATSLNLPALSNVLLPYLGVGACFVTFLAWNGGIVLGKAKRSLLLSVEKFEELIRLHRLGL